MKTIFTALLIVLTLAFHDRIVADDLHPAVDAPGFVPLFNGKDLSGWQSGLEVQILDTYGLAKPGHHDCGGIVHGIGPSKNMVKPAGEWN